MKYAVTIATGDIIQSIKIVEGYSKAKEIIDTKINENTSIGNNAIDVNPLNVKFKDGLQIIVKEFA